MKSLNDIVKDNYAIENALMDNGGEITPEIEAMIEGNEKDFNAKIDRYAGVINHFKTQIAGIDERKRQLDERKKTLKNAIERVRGMLLWGLQSRGVKKVNTGEYVAFSTTRKTAVVHEDQIPDDLLMEMTDNNCLEYIKKFDKTEIKNKYSHYDFVETDEKESVTIK